MGVLDEIQQQPSVFVLSGPAIVITIVATGSAFLADGWSSESVSRVVRTARTTQENNERERAAHADCSHIHDVVTISDAFPVTGQGLDDSENITENTILEDDQDDETETVLIRPSADTKTIFRRSMRTWGTHQIAHWYGCYVVVEPSADSVWQPPSTAVVLVQKRPAGPIVSRSPNSFVFNDVVGPDLFFFNTCEKHTLACHEHCVLGHCFAMCYSPAGISREKP